MNGSYPPILEELGRGAPLSLVRVSGGCIADAATATFADGTQVFVKRAAGVAGMFEREAEGLRALAEARAIRIPEVLAVGSDSLVLEMIHEAPKKKGFYESFGRAFARLHQFRGKACGFPNDNFIGATAQANGPLDCGWDQAVDEGGQGWPEFFMERRLRFQVRLAERRGHGTELGQLLDRSEAQIMDLLGAAIESPSLLHGDLWGGNYIVDDQGEPCLIDPAAYFGHREADLAMTRLFGGFTSSFYAAYQDSMPLAAGHEERLSIYQLYHILNHLNLFGGGYYEQSRRILQRYSR